MPGKLEEKDWVLLIDRIKAKKCTPFLGAGACVGTLPLGAKIARTWAQEHNYPLADTSDLARVAQFLAVKFDAMYPKDELLRRFFAGKEPPKFDEANEPHGVLASLPLPVYMTTNYDDFMVQALARRDRDPKREYCRWHGELKVQPSIFDSCPGFEPTPANPLVFHLHGYDKVSESLVLTEDDYLAFLANMSSQQIVFPTPVRRVLVENSLLFIGYSFNDWTFRVLIQSLRLVGRRCIAVLQLPENQEVEIEKVQSYLEKYYERITKMDLGIYWGTAREFAAELHERWERRVRST